MINNNNNNAHETANQMDPNNPSRDNILYMVCEYVYDFLCLGLS